MEVMAAVQFITFPERFFMAAVGDGEGKPPQLPISDTRAHPQPGQGHGSEASD